jgi:diguanylate cyclase (GGDEF)-like protein
MVEDNEGTLWIGTWGNGIWKRSRTGQFQLATGEQKGDERVRAATLDGEGRVVLGTYGSGLLVTQDNGHLVRVAEDEGLGSLMVRSLLGQPEKTWIGTNRGVWVLNADLRVRAFEPPGAEDLRERRVTSIYETDDGRLLFGTVGEGLYRWNGQYLDRIGTDLGLANNSIYAITQDREGNLWFGTWGDGVSRLGNESFVNFVAQEGLPDPNVYTVVEDNDGSVWFGTSGGGLSHLTEKGFSRFGREDGLAHERVTTGFRDRQGHLWFGTLDGLTVLRDGRPTTYGTEHGLPSEIVYDLTETDTGELWVATLDGLARWTGSAFEVPRELQWQKGNRLYSLAYDAGSGIIWAGGSSGLFRLDSSLLQLEPAGGEPFLDRTVYDLAVDEEGAAWAATDRGLRKVMGDNEVQVWSRETGLPDDTCMAVTQATDGAIWVGTVRGIARLARDGALQIIDRDDGLPVSEINRGAAYLDSQGRLWFGTSKGVSRFTSHLPRPPIPAPRVHIVAVSTPRRELHPARAARLSWNENFVRFDFVGISFTAPAAVEYQYRLEGLDSDWQSTRARETRYTSLPPGAYRFLVRARNADGVASDPAAFPFSVVPPFWRRWEFQLLTLGLVLALILWRYRTLAARNRWLEARVRDRTAEIARLADEMRNLAITDDLTGLRNRRFLELSMPERVAELKRIHRTPSRRKGQVGGAIILLDLDNFKEVNDNWGHATGDVALRQVGEHLRNSFRPRDIVVRWGGDEFLIFLGEVPEDLLPVLAARPVGELRSHPVSIPGAGEIEIKASLGYAPWPRSLDPSTISWNDVVALADAALYCAKTNGGNQAVGLEVTDEDQWHEMVARVRDRGRQCDMEGLPLRLVRSEQSGPRTK